MIEFGENAKFEILTSWLAALAPGVIVRAIETATNSAIAAIVVNEAKRILKSFRLVFKNLSSNCMNPSVCDCRMHRLS